MGKAESMIDTMHTADVFFHKKNAIAPMYIFIQVPSDMMTGTVPSSNGLIQKNKRQLRLCFS